MQIVQMVGGIGSGDFTGRFILVRHDTGRLFGALPDQVSSSRTDASGRPGNDGSSEFIPGNGESRFSIYSVPIRESTTLNVTGNGLI